MKKRFSNLNVFLVIILALQLTFCIFRLYYEFLSIQIWFNLSKNNPVEFQEIKFSYLRIILNFIFPFILCLFGIFGFVLILKQKKFGFLLSFLFWLSFLIFSLTFLNSEMHLKNIEYVYLIFINVAIASATIYLGKKTKHLFFKTDI